MTNLNKKNTRKTFTTSLIAAVVIGAVSLPAAAGKHRGHSNYSNANFDYARVVSVNPVFETYQVNHPVEHCWNEQMQVHDRAYSNNSRHRNKSATPVILGAIIGGIVGNRVGKSGGGRSRDVATVAGAVLGGSVASDVKRNNRRNHYDNGYQTTRYETVQRCELQDSYVTKQKVVGYDVAYKYRGNVFHTKTNKHPGDKIKVKVSVNPVYN